MSIDPIHYQQRAEDAEKLALAASEPEEIAFYREIAFTWQKLAEIGQRFRRRGLTSG